MDKYFIHELKCPVLCKASIYLRQLRCLQRPTTSKWIDISKCQLYIRTFQMHQYLKIIKKDFHILYVRLRQSISSIQPKDMPWTQSQLLLPWKCNRSHILTIPLMERRAELIPFRTCIKALVSIHTRLHWNLSSHDHDS